MFAGGKIWSMGWSDFLMNIALRVPWEQVFISARDPAKKLKELKEVMDTLSQPEASSSAEQAGAEMQIKPGHSKPTEKEGVALSASPGIITRSDLDPGTLVYQEDMALGEAYLLEDHLKRGCRGCGGDVDCCWKTSDKLSRYAHETLSMITDPFWQNLMALADEIKSKTHPDDVKAGTYLAEYPQLAVRVSEFRRPLQKKAMERAKPEISLEEAKKLAVEEAAKEIERQWHSQEKKQ